jgi:hypothetical protein
MHVDTPAVGEVKTCIGVPPRQAAAILELRR